MAAVRVGVYDENEVFRRGLAACLRDAPDLEVEVVAAAPDDVDACELDVVVTSPAAARVGDFGCPVVVCAAPGDDAPGGEQVAAVLGRDSLDGRQLLGAVRAVGAGLRIERPGRAGGPSATASARLDERSVAVLRLLADGASTSEISARLGYSVRTIKGVIARALADLGSQTRSEAVATALRLRLI